MRKFCLALFAIILTSTVAIAGEAFHEATEGASGSQVPWYQGVAGIIAIPAGLLGIIVSWITLRKVQLETHNLKTQPQRDGPNSVQSVRIEMVPSAATRPRNPLLVVEGRYRPGVYPKYERNIMIFGSLFIVFWCISLFLAVSTAFGTLSANFKFVFPDSLQAVLFIPAFAFVVIFALSTGTMMFFAQVMMLVGKVRVFAGPDIIVVSRFLGFDQVPFFANHTLILANEWRFDGEGFVSRRDGIKSAVPALPDHVRAELIKVLNETWQ